MRLSKEKLKVYELEAAFVNSRRGRNIATGDVCLLDEILGESELEPEGGGGSQRSKFKRDPNYLNFKLIQSFVSRQGVEATRWR